MAAGSGVVMRLLASAYSVAERAGVIVRRVLHSGDLGIVEKGSWFFALTMKDCGGLLVRYSGSVLRGCGLERAGVILKIVLHSGDLGIGEKTGANDLQTLADRLVQKSICTSLIRSFPKVTIIGEEDLPSEEVEEDLIEMGQYDIILQKPCPNEFTNLKEEELVVWVDPLDGTKEYTEGLLDHVTVLIGIAYKGKAIAGVINQPFYNYQMGADATLGRTLWGLLGLGAFGFEIQEVPDGKHIVTTTRSHSNKLVTDAVQAMEPHHVIRVGGAGNKIIQLVEGKASAYVFASPGCKKWDTCAPEAILHAVGGTLTDMHGKPYRYDADVKHMNSAGVLATLRNHQYYASRVPTSVLQALQSD